MKFKNKLTGTIYHISNKELVAQYEGNELFEKVVEAVPTTEKPKKTSKKKED